MAHLKRKIRGRPAPRASRLPPQLDEEQDLLTADDMRLERARYERLVQDERRREGVHLLPRAFV